MISRFFTGNLPIQRRLSLSYMILIISVVILISLVLLAIFFTNIRENNQQEMGLKLGNLSMRIVSQLETVMHIGKKLTNDPEIMRTLDSLSYRDLSDYLDEYYTGQHTSPLIAKLIVVNSNLMLLDPINNRFIYQDAILLNSDFTEFITSSSQVFLSGPGIFPIDVSEKQNRDSLTVVCYQRLFDEQDILAGYLLAVLDKGFLFSTVWEQMMSNEFEGVTIFDQHNECVHTVGSKFTPKDIGIDFSTGLRKSSFWKKIGKERYLVFIQPISGFNWTIAAIVPYNTIFQRLILAFMLILAIGVFAIVISFWVSTLISKKITNPLLEVTQAMHRYDDLKALEPIEVESTGELEYLVTVYNKMVRSVNDSIRSMYDEQEKKNRAELVSMQYEMDFLQAQINPHFIHNTLNAVGYQAQKHGDKELYQSLRAFNTLLRASISGTREMIPLQEELDLVKSFEQIQRLRYGDSFTISYTIIDKQYLQMEVPKLILQPVVENAIFYGEEKDGVTKISIEAFAAGGIFSVRVLDNGPGMDIEYMKQQRNANRRKFNRVGLLNIDERLKILFGDMYGIKITSTLGEGTVITITMPEAVS